MSLDSLINDQSVTTEEYPDIPELPLSLKLRLEKKALGVYLSDHPLNYYGSYIKAFTTHKLEQIPKLKNKTQVIVGGICINIRRHKHKMNKKTKYTVTFNDRSASQDILIFLELGGELKFIKEDMIGFIGGSVSKFEDSNQLILNKFCSLQRAPFIMGRHIILRLSKEDLPKIETLKKCIGEWSTPGRSKVLLDLKIDGINKAIFQADPKYQVKIDYSIINALIRLLGENKVKIVSNNGLAVFPYIVDLDDMK